MSIRRSKLPALHRYRWKRRCRKPLRRAAKTVQKMRWFEVVETRGTIEDDHVAQWQVTLKIGFTLND